MDRLKIVADTNILVSGLLWTGLPHKIIKLAENGDVVLYASLSIIEETSQVLLRPKFMQRVEELKTTCEELIESLLNVVEVVHPTHFVSAVESDPDDNKILECAMEAGADYIISGDTHLTHLQSFQNIYIVTPQKFANLYRRWGKV